MAEQRAGPPRPPPERGRVRHWLRRYQLALVAPLCMLVGALLFGATTGRLSTSAECDEGAHATGDDQQRAEPTAWTCAMHPQIQLPEPGSCPICGMDLVAVGGEGPSGAGSAERVVLSERGKALAQVQTEPVRWADAEVELRLLGKLEVDETKVRTITPWVGGRIDRLYVSSLGQRIRRGQAIASLYSPEIYAAQQDLLAAKRQVERLDRALPVARRAGGRALAAARTRLELLGVSSGEVDKMSARTSPARNVAVLSHYRGTVVEQLVHEGALVEPGQALFKIAELDTVWAQLDAYADDLARIEPDQRVTLLVSSLPGETFEGKVAFVDPVVDPRRRTARVRVEVPNGDGRLRPGMFVDAVVHAPEVEQAAASLVVPASAPLFTGTRSLVYVELTGKERPSYEAREVELGPRAGDVYPVHSGLAEGERVVVRGAFALDSDLQIRGGRSMMSRPDDRERAARQPVDAPPAFVEGLRPVLERYVALSKVLSQDDPSGARQRFAALEKAALGFDPRAPEQARSAWRPLSRKLVSAARRGAHAEGLVAQRRQLDAASRLVIELLQRFGNPLEVPLRLAFCPMAFDDRGALWLQQAEQIENPYFGSEMFRCGEMRKTVAHSEHLGPGAGRLRLQ